MVIEVKLMAQFKKHLPDPDCPDHTCSLEVIEHARVEDVMNRLNISKKIPKLFMINYRYAKEDDVLKEGDKLAVYPRLSGG